MDMTINNPCWKSMQAPWLQAGGAVDEPLAASA
jgi:nitrogenase molybdenum-iron protein alpha chain